MSIDLGTLGVHLFHDEATPELAVEIEKAGYGAVWLMRSPPADLLLAERILDATERIVVGTGVVNIWTADAATVAASFRRLEAAHPGRFLLGIGAGHREVDQAYATPHDALVSYLDALTGVPADRIVLAALGPRMLRLARDRAAGTIPVMVTAEHARQAREVLGAGAIVAPGVHVVLETDVERARAAGRGTVGWPAVNVTNYRNNLRRLGFTDDDLAGEASDRLIDALMVYGDPAAVAQGIKEHLDAGANHVGIALTPGDDPVAEWRAIAEAVSHALDASVTSR